MKNKILLLSLLIVTLFSMNSCGSDEPIDGYEEGTTDVVDPNNPAVNTSLFKADFKGATWTTSIADALITANTIEIVAENSNGEAFAISVNATATGTYKTNDDNVLVFTPKGSDLGYWSTNNDNPTEVTGSITITSINTVNKTISGTFNFKGYWDDNSKAPIEFTNGVFKDIPYIKEGASTGGTGGSANTDTFYAKVDGTEFVENTIDFAEVEASGVLPYYSIVGKKTNGESVGLRIEKSLSNGTYEITSGSNVSGSYRANDVLYNAESGSITITSKTATTISGTFSFVGKNFTTGNTKSITAGTFSVEL